MRILRYWRIVRRARLVILITTVSALLVGFAVTQIQNKVYAARSSVLAPRETASQGFGVLSALLSGGGRGEGAGPFSLPALLGGAPSLTANQEMFVSIL
jgi:hypothetical protein